MFKREKTQQKKNQNSRRNNSNDFSDKTPAEFNDILSEILSMIGVLSVDVLNWKGNVLYSYYRWGKEENVLEEKDLFDLVSFVKKRLSKIEQTDLKHLIIRSEEMNIVVYSTNKVILIIHCDNRVKLALLTLRARRAAMNMSDILS